MNGKIHLGISTCPNDTFTFSALMNHLVDWRGLDFEVELLDIEQLNIRLFAGDFDVAKVSFHAALMLAGQAVVYRADQLWDLVSAHCCCPRRRTSYQKMKRN